MTRKTNQAPDLGIIAHLAFFLYLKENLLISHPSNEFICMLSVNTTTEI